jgi:hypothetical protein
VLRPAPRVKDEVLRFVSVVEDEIETSLPVFVFGSQARITESTSGARPSAFTVPPIGSAAFSLKILLVSARPRPKNALTESINLTPPPVAAEAPTATVRPIKSEEIITRVIALRGRNFFVDIIIMSVENGTVRPRGNGAGHLLKNDKTIRNIRFWTIICEAVSKSRHRPIKTEV